ncbi:MAG: bifunctional homocysteine S-methyltransferase/methylenetetrahydrofolate reductase [Anaerolineae bacterium]|nr:bifunctional homocysteine S-methyltransferase/methylenetetrahydrofolate reductase [Anaerolineae bacterium]
MYIAGSVGPLGVQLAPVGRVPPEDAYAAFREQIEALVAERVDLLIMETFPDLGQLREAVRAARDVSAEVPIVAQATFTRDDRMVLGESPRQAAEALAELDVDVIGANCGGGPAQIMRIIRQMRAAIPGAVFSALPNAGWPEHISGRVMYTAGPDYFAEYALAFAEAGVRLIGGCCGTTPDHTAAMRRALDRPDVHAMPSIALADLREAEAEYAAPEGPGALGQQLESDAFIITVEMSPPRGIVPNRVIAGARMFIDAGADFINVSDSPMARMRMSPWAVAHLLQRDAGVEAILHFPTRGRNLLRVQGDLLAAHALGVRNLFIVMGDPTHIGDYPDAADNYDVAPSGLIRLVKQSLNAGQDGAGNVIGQPCSFVAGCALNMGAPDLEREVRVLRKKIEAGADFALTQPVFDPDVARRFFAAYAERHGPLTLPVLVGLMPLHTARHARFLHHEVPGIQIPDAIMARMERAGEATGAEGVGVACEIVAGLKAVEGVRGLYVIPQFGRYDLAAEIIDCVSEKARQP